MKVDVFAGRVQLLINLLLSSVVARGHSLRQEESKLTGGIAILPL